MATGSSHAAIVAHIKGVLDTVTGLGKVITRPKDLKNIPEVEAEFSAGTPAIINAWVISREAVRVSRTNVPSSHEYRLHQYVVRGLYQLNEEKSSDDTFQQLINDILDAFTTRRQKFEASATVVIEDTDEVMARLITVVSYSGYVVHMCEIELVLRERITGISYV